MTEKENTWNNDPCCRPNPESSGSFVKVHLWLGLSGGWDSGPGSCMWHLRIHGKDHLNDPPPEKSPRDANAASMNAVTRNSCTAGDHVFPDSSMLDFSLDMVPSKHKFCTVAVLMLNCCLSMSDSLAWSGVVWTVSVLYLLLLFATGSFLQKSAKLFFRRRHQRKDPGMSQSHNDLVYLESSTTMEQASRTATLSRMLSRKSKSKSKANGCTSMGDPHAWPSHSPSPQSLPQLPSSPPPQSCTS